MTSGKKLDLYKECKAEYAAKQKPAIVETVPAQYLAIAGQGEPGGMRFQEYIGHLYAMAFTVKMASKAAGRDYAVCKLEAQWWGPRGKRDFSDIPKKDWRWNLLIRTPDFIGEKEVETAKTTLLEKGKDPGLKHVALETLDEGRCVQALHAGPYEEEGRTMGLMAEAAKEHGLRFRGRHHEIYLSDPRRVAPERLRTILRMPVG